MRLSGVIVLSCLFAAGLGASIAEVKADISAIPPIAQTLETAITFFSESVINILTNQAIVNNTANLVAAFNKSSTDLTALVPVPFSIADATVIIYTLSEAEGVLRRVAAGLSKDPASFVAVPICGMLPRVNRDISNLITSVAALRDALVTTGPTNRASLLSLFLDNIRHDFVSLSHVYQCVLSVPLD